MKMMAISLSLAAITGFGVASANAQPELPYYDVEAYCDGVAEMMGGSAEMRRLCIQQEQRSYDRMKRSWGDVAESVREYCDRTAQMMDSSYQMLAICVDQEVQAQESMPTFER